MFVKKYEKFKKDVEDTIYAFFRMKPEELKVQLDFIHQKYDSLYDLDNVLYKDVKPELKDMLMMYKTMNYFYNIWDKLNELESYITMECLEND